MALLWQSALAGSQEPHTIKNTENAMKRTLFFRAFAMGAFMTAAFVSALPGAAMAADSKGRSAIDGIGAAPCSALIEAQKAEDASFFISLGGWIDGYISAVNTMNADTFDLTPWEKTELFLMLIEGNCQQNPDLQIVAIVHGLVQSLLPDRLTAPSENKQIDLGEGRKVTHYVETLRRIQKALKERGHYTGAIDGDYGPGTRSAMAAFQKSAELEPTGLPDQLTLLRLLHPGGPGGQ